MAWCGYIDVLGTKAAAETNSDVYVNHIFRFHGALEAHFGSFKDGWCMAMSDGAFIKTSQFHHFYDYYKRVRNLLFSRGMYFKCSYMEGDIQGEPSLLLPSGKRTDKPQLATFQGFRFSGSASEAYVAETKFHGAGCIISLGTQKKLSSKSLNKKHIVKNYFLNKEAKKLVPKKFYDFKFNEYELSPADNKFQPSYENEERLVDFILYSCSVSLLSSDNYATKFIPIIVNMIRSSDFTKIGFTDNEWNDTPMIFTRLLVDKKPFLALKKIPGLKYVFLTMFDKVYLDAEKNPDISVCQYIIRFLSRQNGWLRNLDEIPDFVITPEARKYLIDMKAESDGFR